MEKFFLVVGGAGIGFLITYLYLNFLDHAKVSDLYDSVVVWYMRKRGHQILNLEDGSTLHTCCGSGVEPVRTDDSLSDFDTFLDRETGRFYVIPKND